MTIVKRLLDKMDGDIPVASKQAPRKWPARLSRPEHRRSASTPMMVILRKMDVFGESISICLRLILLRRNVPGADLRR